jgi:outer membrane protein W
VKALLAIAIVLAAPSLAFAAPRAKKTKKKPAPAPTPEPAPKAETGQEIDMAAEPAPTPAVAAETQVSVEAEPAAPVVVVEKAAPAKPKIKRLYLRAGVAVIKPLSVSREMELSDVDGAASLAIENGPIAGSGAAVGSATVPALIIGYRLPVWNNRLSLETVLGVPFEVKLKATGTLRDESLAPMALGIPTGVPPLGEDLGTAQAAPPMLTAVYDLLPNSRIRPYAGAGVAVLFAFDEKVTNPLLSEVGQPEMTIAPAPGLVFQSGIDAKLFGRVYARIDVKFIALMMARAEVKHVQVRTPELPLFDTVEVGTAKMNVWVNPLVIQAGIGTDF